MGYVTYVRPKHLTAICVAGFVLVLFSMPSVFSPDTRKMGDFFPALYGLLIALRFIAYVGIWHMKRWGVELLLITFVAQIIDSIVLDSVNPIGVIYHIGVLADLVYMYRKMDRNL